MGLRRPERGRPGGRGTTARKTGLAAQSLGGPPPESRGSPRQGLLHGRAGAIT